jgi:mannose-6-phosphate isomerase-like protein (cupin superfamily)
MRVVTIGGVLALLSASVFAEQAPPAMPAPAAKSVASSAEVTALVAKAKRDRKEGEGIIQQRLLLLGPYKVNIEYRASVSPAMVHEQDAEFICALEGAGTFVIGGQLLNQTRTPQSLSGTGIDGGTPHHIAKGDFVMVPEGTPHWYSAVESPMVLMSVHLPRTAAAAGQVMKNMATSTDVAALVAKAKSERKGDQAVVTEPMLALAPYAANIEYRVASGTAVVHEQGVELLYMLDGSATFVMGGTLVDEKRGNPTTLSGSGIVGGTAQHVATGDFVMVPEGTPHWFSALDGPVQLMALHLPPAAQAGEKK